MSPRQPYQGVKSKLCVAFDIGFTYSGVAYCVLVPGRISTIYSVARYPGQKSNVARSKVPSVLYYDQYAKLRAVGAETLRPEVAEQARKESWDKVSWFKLLFAPKTANSKDIRRHKSLITNSLPVLKTEIEVMADYMGYLFECTKAYIHESHPDGVLLWQSLEDDISFVLSHPNGWGGIQQRRIKSAMALAGLISDSEQGRERVGFVSEGEACLHYCLNKQLESSWKRVKAGDGVVIVDAGGGTIDVSAYDVVSNNPPSFQELNLPESLFQGSQFVTSRIEAFLRETLKDPDFNLPNACELFDQASQPVFHGENKSSHHKLVHSLPISSSDIEEMLEPTISSLVDSIKRQREGCYSKIKTVFLLGGFAANSLLSERLESRLRLMHIRLIKPDVLLNRAAAEGAVSFYIQNHVHLRIARFTYGVMCTREYEHNHPEHRKRSSSVILNPSGTAVLPGGYQTVLRKGTEVAENREFSWVFLQESILQEKTHSVSCNITSYRGKTVDPQWVDTEPDLFEHVFTIHADISPVPKLPRCNYHSYPSEGGGDSVYFQQRFRIVLLFGMTELKAQIRWHENGVEKRNIAQIIYEKETS